MTGRTAEVFEEIARRRFGQAGNWGTKLGLVVEGGAMRGVVSMAYLAALERHQASGVFDAIFAESSGAVNAAYFVSRQAQAGLELYRRAVRAQLVHKWRVGRMLDLEAAFTPIAAGELSLDCDSMRASPTMVQVSLTDSENGLPVALPLLGSDQRIHTMLKATSAMVPYYNRPILLDGRGYVDGGIADPIPIGRAIQAGCSHILVLLTRPEDYQPRRLSRWEQVATRLLVARWSAEFRNVFHHTRPRRYYRSRAIALGRERPARVSVAAITPPASLGRIERFLAEPGRLQTVADICTGQMESLIASWAGG